MKQQTEMRTQHVHITPRDMHFQSDIQEAFPQEPSINTGIVIMHAFRRFRCRHLKGSTCTSRLTYALTGAGNGHPPAQAHSASVQASSPSAQAKAALPQVGDRNWNWRKIFRVRLYGYDTLDNSQLSAWTPEQLSELKVEVATIKDEKMSGDLIKLLDRSGVESPF
jgi:hypothetical protein